MSSTVARDPPAAAHAQHTGKKSGEANGRRPLAKQ
jgi:hypothetical protein